MQFPQRYSPVQFGRQDLHATARLTLRTRFAPSPTGYLHLGHAYSAMLAYDMARKAGGELILRIEDTDTGRCRPEYEAAIHQDLRWLGLSWPSPVLHQLQNLPAYALALNRLINAGLCYPCSCTRKDIRNALTAPQAGGHTAHGPVYPGTCRHRPMSARTDADAIRLDMSRALSALPRTASLSFDETGPDHTGTHHLDPQRLLSEIGDIVLSRSDIASAAYHLCVVVDDAAQGITHVIRGQDLFGVTHIHRLLQALLGLPTPAYHHHRLITDEAGNRLAKRDDARAIRKYRSDGLTPADIRVMVGLPPISGPG